MKNVLNKDLVLVKETMIIEINDKIYNISEELSLEKNKLKDKKENIKKIRETISIKDQKITTISIVILLNLLGIIIINNLILPAPIPILKLLPLILKTISFYTVVGLIDMYKDLKFLRLNNKQTLKKEIIDIESNIVSLEFQLQLFKSDKNILENEKEELETIINDTEIALSELSMINNNNVISLDNYKRAKILKKKF